MSTTKSKKRILVVCQRFWPESFRLNDVCDSFIEKGYEVDVLCGMPNYPTGTLFDGYTYFNNRKQQYNGMTIHRVFEIPRGNGSNVRIMLNNLAFPVASLFHLPRLLTKKYDKIFIYELSPVMMALPGILLGKMKKIETTMWVIDIWPDNLFSYLNVKNKFLRKIATVVSHWHYKNVDKIVALTETMEHKLAKVSGLPKVKITNLPQACEKLYEEEAVDKKLQKKFAGGFNILFTGTITPILSFDTVVKAATILKDKGYKDINWVIVGGGSSMDWLKKETKARGLAKNFFFEGIVPKEEIPRYTTNAADALLSTLIKNELMEVTVPAKIASYLAAGKPLILAMNGEANKLINNTIKCGFAGPAEDAEALAANVIKLYEMSPKQRKALGDKAREYHFKHLERNLVMDKLEKFIFK